MRIKFLIGKGTFFGSASVREIKIDSDELIQTKGNKVVGGPENLN